MKRSFGMKVFASVFFVFCFFSPMVYGTEATKSKVDAVQKKCPIMGGEISKKVFTDFDGKRVYFCCPGCIGKFEAEPKKYLAQFQKAGIALDLTPTENQKKSGQPGKAAPSKNSAPSLGDPHQGHSSTAGATENRQIEGKSFPTETLQYQSHEGNVTEQPGQAAQDVDSLTNTQGGHEGHGSAGQSGHGSCGGGGCN